MSDSNIRIVERTFLNRARQKLRQRLSRNGSPATADASGGEPVRVGLIGLGNIAKWAYLPRLRNSSRYRLTAVYDVDEVAMKSVAESFGARACQSADEVASAAEVDAVFICTPVRYHCEAALAALRARKHVLCEKPLGFDFEEAKEMWAAAQEAGTTTMVNFSFRFRPEVLFLGQLLRAGTIGCVYHLWGSLSQGQWFTNRSEPSNARNDAAPWKFGPEGGVVDDLGPHVVDLLRFWLGEMTHVQAWTTSFRPGPKISEDACGMSLWFADGPMAQITTSRWATAFKDRIWFEIYGSEGTIIFQPGSIRLWTRAEPRWRELLIPPTEASFLDCFHAAIRNGSNKAPDFFDGLKNNEVLDAVIQSAEHSRTVTLSGIKETAPLTDGGPAATAVPRTTQG